MKKKPTARKYIEDRRAPNMGTRAAASAARAGLNRGRIKHNASHILSRWEVNKNRGVSLKDFVAKWNARHGTKLTPETVRSYARTMQRIKRNRTTYTPPQRKSNPSAAAAAKKRASSKTKSLRPR